MNYTIDDYKKMFIEAQARGDSQTMKYANDGANAIRTQTGEKHEDASGVIRDIAYQQQQGTFKPTTPNYSYLNKPQTPATSTTSTKSIFDTVKSITSNLSQNNVAKNNSSYFSSNTLNISPSYTSNNNYNNTQNPTQTSDPYIIDQLNGWKSGTTTDQLGYNSFYTNQLNNLNKKYDGYVSAGNTTMANSYLDAINRFQDKMHASSLHKTDFAGWDTGHLDLYIGNKAKYDQATPEEQAKFASVNKYLRDMYGMTEDKYTYNDLGQLRSDLIYGDFLQYGLNTGTDVPQQYNLNGQMRDMPGLTQATTPQRDMAQKLARRDYLLGYEPLGQITKRDGSPIVTHNPVGASKMKFTSSTLDMYNGGDSYSGGYSGSSYSNYVPSSTPQTSTPQGTTNTIMLSPNNPQAGIIYETSGGRFFDINGQRVKLSDDEYINMMAKYLGF